MYCEKAEIPASEKFQAVRKLAPSTKLPRSLKMLMRFDSRFHKSKHMAANLYSVRNFDFKR